MSARVPVSAARGPPGDAELAAAAEVVRLTYGAEIEAAVAREEAVAVPPVAADMAHATPPPQIVVVASQVGPVSAQAFQGAAQVVQAREDAPQPTAPAVAVHDGSKEKQPACRSVRRSLDVMPDALARTSTSGRHITASELIATSPHCADSNVDTASPAESSDADKGRGYRTREELLADNDDDLNNIETNASGQYGAIESGDEAEKDDVETGEYESDEDVQAHCLPEDVADDPEETESEIAAEVLFAEDFLESFGGVDQVLAGNLKNPVLRSMTATGWEDVVEPDIHQHLMAPYEPVEDAGSYPRLRQGYSGPTAEALRHGDSPVALFFYFLPVVLWQHIAACSNEYHREMLPRRIDEAYQRYRKKQRRKPDLPRKTRRDIQHDMETMKPIMPHELCQFIGLLAARTIAPNREKLANHWKTTDVGAISRGSFGSVISRDRFMEISRNLHFNSNSDVRAQTDRAWKIRKVVEVLQRTFARGYISPSHLTFDETVLPSRSSFNKMRVYMKDKPHKWGTKLFMLCSAVTAHCIQYVFFVPSI
ncbi:unnamed protein product [Phytophthora fragariaefolia]|uniref:Unnamed protein product n=1 Tax=Phytophthora fragariaefolia TaxID=1490495 RepID=A0A9W6UEH3_9STRA|nr:unnamed protein product [Phytophthora fragariaefolia]